MPRRVCFDLVEPVDNPPLFNPQDTAALVIGGSATNRLTGAAGVGAELFGCPNSAVPIPVSPFPAGTGVILTAGTFLHGSGTNENDPGKVLACGGFASGITTGTGELAE